MVVDGSVCGIAMPVFIFSVDMKLTIVIFFLDFSGRDEFLTLSLSSSLLDCFNKFRSSHYRSHRIALLNDNGSVEKIVAMLDLIRFASDHINAIPFVCDFLDVVIVAVANVVFVVWMCDTTSVRLSSLLLLVRGEGTK